MIKGTIFIDVDGSMDMERLVRLLADNDYEVRVRRVEGFDCFTMQYQIDYKRKEDMDE